MTRIISSPVKLKVDTEELVAVEESVVDEAIELNDVVSVEDVV